MQIGVNHFGHFYLTYLLWKQLKAAKNPRIINVSSLAHKERRPEGNINFEDFAYATEPYNSMTAYSRSKKANILFTKELQKRIEASNGTGLTYSLHPGVVRTELGRYFINTMVKKLIGDVLLLPLKLVFMKSSMEGAQTTLYTIFEDEHKLEAGGYYADCSLAPIQSAQCNDPNASLELWRKSEEVLGIKFNL